MLEDCVRQLASTSQGTRLDAYKALNGCLQAYQDLPDPRSMEEKLPLLADFVQRDLEGKGVAEKNFVDTQLQVQALKLTVIFLKSTNLAEKLQDEFQSFILEQAIRGLGDSTSAKVLISHYMQILSRQNFGPKSVNHDRVNQLLTLLGDVTTVVKGNNVVGQRLMVYQRLLQQAKPVMIARVNDWVDHLYAGLHSSLKEIRTRALDFGFEASLTLGSTSQISRAVIDLFNRLSNDGRKVADFLSSRLNEMIDIKEDIMHVPQIWSVTILFLRSRPNQLARWEHLNDWISIIQRCFNASDRQVKTQAFRAWNHFIFTVNPSLTTSPQWSKSLQRPIMTQLKTRSDGKSAIISRQSAQASYCTLLYYSFRPGATHETFDRFWKEYVTPLKDQPDSTFACQVMTYLMGDGPQTTWNSNRGNETSPMTPEELPRLDPRWIRLRANVVINLFEHLWRVSNWSSVDGKEAWVLRAWRSFTRALGDAGSKEIKVSGESMAAMAYMTSSMRGLWISAITDGLPRSSASASSKSSYLSLLQIAALNVGSLPFTEKRLVQSHNGTFEAAETPSSRHARVHGSVTSAMLSILEMVTSSTNDRDTNNEFVDVLRELLSISLRSATSRLSRLKVLRDIVPFTFSETLSIPNSKVLLWQIIADCLSEAMDSDKHTKIVHDSPRHLGQDFREAIKILDFGTRQDHEESMATWIRTLQHIDSKVQEEVGIGGSVLAVVEPLASSMLQRQTSQCTSDVLQRGTAIIQCARWPSSRKVVESAQRDLWGAVTTTTKSPSFTPYDKLYDLVDEILLMAYRYPEVQTSPHIIHFIQAVTRFVDSCPLSQSEILLKRIQCGLAIWIADDDGWMGSPNPHSKRLLSAVSIFLNLEMVILILS